MNIPEIIIVTRINMVKKKKIRASKCEHIKVFISHSLVLCRKRLPECELKWDIKSGKLSHCSLFNNKSVFHNCSFLLKAVFCHKVAEDKYLFLEVRCLIDLMLQKYHKDTPTESGKLHPQR